MSRPKLLLSAVVALAPVAVPAPVVAAIPACHAPEVRLLMHGNRLRIGAAGLGHGTVYLHYIGPHGWRETNEIGAATGRCGSVETRWMPLFWSIPTAGHWTITADTHRYYSARSEGPAATVRVVVTPAGILPSPITHLPVPVFTGPPLPPPRYTY
jgi:hypothetical protein